MRADVFALGVNENGEYEAVSLDEGLYHNNCRHRSIDVWKCHGGLCHESYGA